MNGALKIDAVSVARQKMKVVKTFYYDCAKKG